MPPKTPSSVPAPPRIQTRILHITSVLECRKISSGSARSVCVTGSLLEYSFYRGFVLRKGRLSYIATRAHTACRHICSTPATLPLAAANAQHRRSDLSYPYSDPPPKKRASSLPAAPVRPPAPRAWPAPLGAGPRRPEAPVCFCRQSTSCTGGPNVR